MKHVFRLDRDPSVVLLDDTNEPRTYATYLGRIENGLFH